LSMINTSNPKAINSEIACLRESNLIIPPPLLTLCAK
jgi:hypothetical protein